jgi:microcystin degradation protein MlrC
MKKVLTCDFSHETNTFSVLPTTIDNFRHQSFLVGDLEVSSQHRNTKSTIGATYEAAEKFVWNLTVPVAASSNPTGKITSEAFEQISGYILNRTTEFEPNGILLHLHGAMVSEEFEDCEGELLQRVRKIVGNEIPIVVTLDLHGNITSLMAEMANILLAVRTYPHIDFYEIAERAACLLEDCMMKRIEPKTIIAKRPMTYGLDGGKTHENSPMLTLIRRGEELEKSGDFLVVSICAGFTAADIYDIGPSVTVTIDMKPFEDEDSKLSALTKARNVAEEFMDYVWETRHYQSEKYHSVESAINHITNFLENRFTTAPIVVADVTDNPGSGHYGDATDLLRAITLNNTETTPLISDVVFYAIYDSEAVIAAQTIGVGNYGTLRLGGKFDPTAGGGTLELYGKVVALTDGCFQTWGPMGFGGLWQNFGLSVLFRYERNIDIIIISHNGQLLDTAQITSMGVDINRKKVICVKSKHHFRACLSPIASEIICVDGGGLGNKILGGGQYKNVRRPIWPLDFS